MALSKKKKILLGVIGAVVVAAGAKMALGGGNTEGYAEFVSTSFIERQDLDEVIKLKSILEGTESVEVVSRMHYEVTELLVQEGDKVTQGQLLARLDTAELSRQIAVTDGEIQLIRLQQEETLKDRQKAYDEAKKEYEKIKELHEAGAASQRELDDVKAAMDKIHITDGAAVLTSAEQQMLSNALQQRNNQAVALGHCEVRSMIDGTVTRVNTKVGRFADETEGNKPMFVIENIEELQMRVLVSENDIAKIEVGQSVEITADILNGDVVEGVVSRISPTGEAKDVSSSERVIPVYVTVTQQHERLIAGITARATIYIDSASNTLTVPYEAIGETLEGETVVYVVNEDNTIRIVAVELGLETDLLVEIISAELTEGMQIVLNPSLTLTEGMAVIPQ